MGLGKSTRSGGSIVKAVDKAVDGHAYYLIQGNLEKGVANVKRLDFYYGLAPYSPVTGGDGTAEQVGNVDGFFFVRNAADGHVKGDGQGDPTVHAGWAMYIWDPQDYIKRKPATNAGWVKIAQQGDVDWDITDELKALFVLKTVFNARVNEVDNRFAQDEAVTNNINVRLLNIEKDWDEGDDVHGKAHWHDNKDVLDRLSEKYQSLYYRGKPISGNSYIYDHVEYKTETAQKEIVWCDPTISSSLWTHATVKNSDEIAQKIMATEIARVGLSLFVMEVDGSVSIYKYLRDETAEFDESRLKPLNIFQSPPFDTNELPSGTKFYSKGSQYGATYVEETKASIDALIARYSGTLPLVGASYYYLEPTLTYKFAQTCVTDNVGLAEYVLTLPTATKWHYKRGAWVPLKNDGEHIAGHLHECVEDIDNYIEATGETYKASTVYYQRNPTTREVYVQTHVRITDGTIDPAALQLNGLPILRARVDGEAPVYSYRWVDMHDSGSSISAFGAQITLCYAEDTTLWKDVKIFWKDPEDTVESGIPIKWAQTVLVRKVGSAPQHANDGVQVAVSTTRNQYKTAAFCDTLPFSYQDVYYRVFSVSKLGSYFASNTAVVPKKLTWTDIQDVISRGDASLLFSIGDTIVLPPHSIYGDIECEVVDINPENKKGILVVAKDVLCMKVIDAPEGKLSGTSVNPEWSDDFGTARGSNGVVSGNRHNVSTTNIWQWLNSAEVDWFSAATPWDTPPSYSTEPGFLSGFPESMMSLFMTIPGSGHEASHTQLPDSIVALPLSDRMYFAKITKSMQCGRSKTPVEWATFTGVESTYTETQRMNYGFKTIISETETGAKVPEVQVGIVPMFLLGKRS